MIGDSEDTNGKNLQFGKAGNVISNAEDTNGKNKLEENCDQFCSLPAWNLTSNLFSVKLKIHVKWLSCLLLDAFLHGYIHKIRDTLQIWSWLIILFIAAIVNNVQMYLLKY